jgi:hypothetical protein
VSGHTKGPWSGKTIYVTARALERLGVSLGFVITAEERVRAEAEANARLIAAAPELLSVCLLFARWAQACDDFRYPPGSLQQLHAAIASTASPASVEPGGER